jgi:flavin reductase (DIM6/NTAB) family NADH-FMN oxidoreductase RutF
MERIDIQPEELVVRAHGLWDRQWLLLTAGDFAADDFNTMTVSYGALGTMWHRPLALVVVRPTRFTHEFMERHASFTLCAFPEERREALKLLGTRSGRDGDKIAAAGLTPTPARSVAAPAFAEAELVIECAKMYWQDMEAAHFLRPDIEAEYPEKDYHRIYFGEILAAAGVPAYRAG